MEVRLIHTCDNYLSAAPVGAALVSAGTNVDTSITGLDVGEVQLCSCTHTGEENGVICTHNMVSHQNVYQCQDKLNQTKTLTLSASVCGAGDGSPVLSGPVEVVRRRSRHLAAQSDRAALGGQDPPWINPHHQGGCSCKGQRSQQTHQGSQIL